MLNAKLVIVGGKSKTKEVNLKLPTIIGRGKEADLTIPHALVSRSHSELFERDGQLCVKDLGSLNGTFVDNKRIDTEQILSPNQLLTLGNITFRAVYEIDQSAKPTLPNVPLDTLQTIFVDPVNTSSSSDSEQTVDADPVVAPNVDPAINLDQAPAARSTISEIDSFDPDEIGSLDDVDAAEKAEPIADKPIQTLNSKKTIVPPAHLTLRDQPSPKKSPAKKTSTPPGNQPAAADAPSNLGLTNLVGEPSIAQLIPLDVDLDLVKNNVASPVSFVGDLQTGEDANSPSIVDDFQIDLDSGGTPSARVDESQLGSFLKNLPK